MKNYIQPGVNMTVPAPVAVSAGFGILVGALFGVAQFAAEAGDEVVIITEGVFELPKLEAQAWAVGQKVYWDGANDRCTTVASGNKLIGVAAVAANDPSLTGQVRLGIVA